MKLIDLKSGLLFIITILNLSFTYAQMPPLLPIVNLQNKEIKLFKFPLQIALDSEIGFPISSFGKNSNKFMLIGKGISFNYPIIQNILEIGTHYENYSYDHTVRYYDFNVQKTKSKLWQWDLSCRLTAKQIGKIKPYIEGGWGYNRFYTKTYSYERGAYFWQLIFSDDDYEVIRFDEAKLHSSWVQYYSLGVGWNYIFNTGINKTSIGFHSGYRHSKPGEYLVKENNNFVKADPNDNYYLQEGHLSFMFVRLSLSVYLQNTVVN